MGRLMGRLMDLRAEQLAATVEGAKGGDWIDTTRQESLHL